MIEATKYSSFLRIIISKCKENGTPKPVLNEEQYKQALKISCEIEKLVKELCNKKNKKQLKI